ncbi:MAG: Chaperone for flagella basal body P-ring formation [Planctomycetota bacterium]|jgi:flagella basal body P-ring formation protein FlgA
MQLVRNALRIAAVLLCAGSAAGDTVTLMPSVRIAPGAEFTLAEIASLDGDAARALAEVRVGRGETGAFELGAERIRQKLVVAGADMRRIEIRGTRTVVRPLRAVSLGAASTPPSHEAPVAAAEPGSRIVDPNELAGTGSALAVMCEMVANAFGDDAGTLRLEFSEEQLAKIAPREGCRYEVARRSLLRTSRIEFEVVIHEPSGDEIRTRVRATPRLERKVAVAREDIRRGTTANDGLVALETRLLPLADADDAAEPRALAGADFARSVKAGDIIERTDLVRPAEIKRRDAVTVRREIGAIVIELDAIALEDGAIGDTIAFERIDGTSRSRSRDARSFTAEVVGPGRAVIR